MSSCHQLEAEEWFTIPGHPKFSVSSHGRAWGPYGERKVRRDKNGYLHILCHVGNSKYVLVLLHRALCTIYYGPPPFEGAMALHRNGIKEDVSRDNLYWGSHQQNMLDAHTHKAFATGENNPRSKLTLEQVNAIKASDKSNVKLAAESGVSPPTIGYIKNGKTWK